MAVLITGGSGQLGSALKLLYEARGNKVYAPDRSQMDLNDSNSIRDALNLLPLRAVINCAAYTAVDRAESEIDLARNINAVAPGIIATECQRLKIPLIHISTDYVFDGRKDAPYTEEDDTNPLSVYGKTKLAGEEAVINSGAAYSILRTAWVLSASGSNFLKTMIRLATQLPHVKVVDDQFGNPTSAKDIANAVALIDAQRDRPDGIWNFTNAGETSWHGLARHIFDRLSSSGIAVAQLSKIPTSEYPTPAIRPKNSRLSCQKFTSDFINPPRPWQDAVDEILDEILK